MNDEPVTDPHGDEHPITVDLLYLDLEHFVLTTETQPPLEPRARVVPIGEPRTSFPLREKA
ncbi:hypothetical protein ACWDUC_13985 [Streptomyces tricolor]